MKRTIEGRLEQAHMAIEGALNTPGIIKALIPLGYDRKAIQGGKALYEQAILQQSLRESEYNTQKDNSSMLKDAFAEARKMYIEHVKLARLSIPPDRYHWHNMKLRGSRKNDMTGWLFQAQAFYRHTAPVAELLAKRGISQEELAQAQAMVEAVAASRVKCNYGKSNAQQAKEQRDKAMQDLQAWMKKFMKAARYAFDENKQQLEALGVVVTS